jgi:hypothetical protein
MKMDTIFDNDIVRIKRMGKNPTTWQMAYIIRFLYPFAEMEVNREDLIDMAHDILAYFDET